MADEKKDINKYIRILSIVFAALLIIVVIIIKVNVTTFSTTYLIVSIILILLFFGTIWFLFTYVFGKKKAENLEPGSKKLPPAVTVEQARELCSKATVNETYANYLINLRNEKVEEFGKGIKSLIYSAQWKTLYGDDEVYTICNMHNPSTKKSILFNPTNMELLHTKMRLADFPEEETPVKEILTRNVITGVEQKISEPMTDKKEEKKEKEGDL